MNELDETMKNEEEQAADSNTWYDEVSARPSTLPDITISLTNFAREEDAQLLAGIIRGYLDFFGKLMNLSGLSRVWVSHDYEGTLANLERGFEAQNTLVPTNDDIGVGIAMTPAVIEDEKVKSVMVLNALPLMVLTQPDNSEFQPYYRQMIYTLAHECGHVHDLTTKARSLPETWLKMRLGRYDGTLFEIADACWSEYIASRLSARLSPLELTGQYEDTFCKQFETGLPSIRGYLRQYRMHADIARVLAECSYVVKKILVYASYLFGQLHGLEKPFDQAAPRAKAQLDHHPKVLALVNQLELELQVLYGAYGHWPSFAVFGPLKAIALGLFAEVGLKLKERADDGISVRIPLTAETTPDLAEQFEFLARRKAEG